VFSYVRVCWGMPFSKRLFAHPVAPTWTRFFLRFGVSAFFPPQSGVADSSNSFKTGASLFKQASCPPSRQTRRLPVTIHLLETNPVSPPRASQSFFSPPTPLPSRNNVHLFSPNVLLPFFFSFSIEKRCYLGVPLPRPSPWYFPCSTAVIGPSPDGSPEDQNLPDNPFFLDSLPHGHRALRFMQDQIGDMLPSPLFSYHSFVVF